MAIHGRSGVCQSNSGVQGYSDIGGYSSGYPWRVAIHGRSGDCQSNSSVRGYSDIRGGIAVTIHGWSGDCQSNSGVREYSDIGGGGVIAVAIHGWSGDCQSNSSVWGYSDIGRYMSGNPCTTLNCQSNSGLQSGGQTRHGITGHHSHGNNLYYHD